MTERTPRLMLLLKPDLLTAIDDYRFGSRIESRNEAIRRLIELGLEAAKEREAAE